MHKGNASICIGGIVITALVYIHILSFQKLSNRTVKNEEFILKIGKTHSTDYSPRQFWCEHFELIAVKINKFGSNTNCALGIEINLKSPTLANFGPFFCISFIF